MLSPLDPAAAFTYNPRVYELFADLRHAGVLDLKGDADIVAPVIVTVEVGSREQGASVCLQVAVANAHIQSARYCAYGCPHFLAACESLARWLEGRAVNEIPQWNWREVEAELHTPPGKRSRWLLLEDAVMKLAKAARSSENS